MSINRKQLENLVVYPALKSVGLYSNDVADLIMGTAAQESHLGRYIAQINGPALGIYQMEPATHDDIVNNYLSYRESLSDKILSVCGISGFSSERLLWDLKYSTIMCRMHYFRVPESLPICENVPAMAMYWKKYYNTLSGKGSVNEFISNFNKYVGE